MPESNSPPTWAYYAAYTGFFLGVSSVLATLCFYFPDILTSPDIRRVYTEQFVRTLFALLLGFGVFCLSLSLLFGYFKKLCAFGFLGVFLSLLLGGPFARLGETGSSPHALGVDWFLLSFVLTAGVLIPLERFFGRGDQSVLRPEWKTDLLYYFVSHTFVQFVLLLTTFGAGVIDSLLGYEPLKIFVRHQHLFLQVLAAIFLADIFQSLIHRLYHRVPFLWRIHQIHHSVEHMDWLAGSRLHIGEILLTRMFVLLPLILFGFSQNALNIYVVVIGVQALLAHANVLWPGGFWEHFVVMPRYHHWHHAKHKDHWDCNYAIHTPLADLLFGTKRLPKTGYPERYGILGGASVPQGFWAQTLYAFGRQYMKKTRKVSSKKP